jgi:hypothetical protein
MLIYNTTLSRLEVYQGGAWVDFVKLNGDTLTGLLQFSGTGHAGLKLNSLTTAQRDALTPSNGMVIYNTTTSKVQQYIGGAWADVASGSGTLTHWTESNSTFGGQEFAKFTPSSGSANVSTVIAPKGTGAFMLDTPDGAATGGNVRGRNAVDMQMVRTSAPEVASGDNSVIAGGQLNKASASNASIGGGYANFATGAQTVIAGGYANQSTNDYASVGGGAENVAIGVSSTIPGGYGNIASGVASIAIGEYANADKRAQFSHGGGRFNVTLPAHSSVFILSRGTTDATPTELYLGGAGGYTDRLVQGAGKTMAFSILVVAKVNLGARAAYKFEGCIKRDEDAASTDIVGTVTKTVLAEDVAAWDANVDADTTNGSLRLQVTGQAATEIYWVARVETVEI